MTTQERLHDLKTVHHDFKIVSELLKDGYRFDDEDGVKVFAQLDKAVAMLNEEIKRLTAEWKP